VWHAAGLVGLVAAAAFILLNRRVERSAGQEPQAITDNKPQAQAQVRTAQ
jgi:hypothetical protein